MKNLFNRKPKDEEDGVVVLSEPGPLECGGTTATRDTRAPKTIVSEEIIFFSAASALDFADPAEDGEEPLDRVFAFAAPAGRGTFLFLSATRGGEERKAWALVKDSPFPALTRLVREKDLARNNGLFSETHGLPENFGGSVDIRYASGEKIRFSDNQAPVLSLNTARALVLLFQAALEGEKAPLPSVSDLQSICFEERREDGGFTTATLTLLPDGTGSNEKRARYADPLIYESTKAVEKETVTAIRKTMEETGILAWADLPENGFKFGRCRFLSFSFKNGETITVEDNKILPDPLRRGFFNIQLELETKH